MVTPPDTLIRSPVSPPHPAFLLLSRLLSFVRIVSGVCPPPDVDTHCVFFVVVLNKEAGKHVAGVYRRYLRLLWTSVWETVFPSGHVTHQWGKCELAAQLWRTVWAGNWRLCCEDNKRRERKMFLSN